MMPNKERRMQLSRLQKEQESFRFLAMIFFFRYNQVGTHQMSGRIIRPFPVSGRAWQTEYPAGFHANIQLSLYKQKCYDAIFSKNVCYQISGIRPHKISGF